MNIEFDSEPVYNDNDKYIKANIKPYGNKKSKEKKTKRKYIK